MLFFRASDLTFTSRHLHSWASFALWPSSFIFPGAISNCPPLFHSSMLGTFWPGEFFFQCDIFSSSCTVHGVLAAGILEWLHFPPPENHILSEFTGTLHLGWPWMAWLIASLNYASPLTTSRLWYMKGRTMPKTCSGHNKHHFPTTTNPFQQSLSHTFFQYKRWLYT